MSRIICPCCKNYKVNSNDEIITDICDMCFWQYDLVAQRKPNTKIGSNGISLNEAIENYENYGACKKEYFDKGLVRKPLFEELPEHNT